MARFYVYHKMTNFKGSSQEPEEEVQFGDCSKKFQKGYTRKSKISKISSESSQSLRFPTWPSSKFLDLPSGPSSFSTLPPPSPGPATDVLAGFAAKALHLLPLARLEAVGVQRALAGKAGKPRLRGSLGKQKEGLLLRQKDVLKHGKSKSEDKSPQKEPPKPKKSPPKKK